MNTLIKLLKMMGFIIPILVLSSLSLIFYRNKIIDEKVCACLLAFLFIALWSFAICTTCEDIRAEKEQNKNKESEK